MWSSMGRTCEPNSGKQLVGNHGLELPDRPLDVGGGQRSLALEPVRVQVCAHVSEGQLGESENIRRAPYPVL